MSETIKQWLFALGLSVATYFSPIKAAIFAVGFLMFLDTLTGVWLAWHKKVKIDPEELNKLFKKMSTYGIAIITCHIMQQEIIGEIIPLVKIAAGSIASKEGFSILRNLNAIQTLPFLKEFMDRVKPPGKEEARENIAPIADIK